MHLPRQAEHCLVLLLPSGQCPGEAPEHHSRQDKTNKDETPRDGREFRSEHRRQRWLPARPNRYTPPEAVHPCTGGVFQEWKVPNSVGHVTKTHVTQVVVDVSCKRQQFCRPRVLMDTRATTDRPRRNIYMCFIINGDSTTSQYSTLTDMGRNWVHFSRYFGPT